MPPRKCDFSVGKCADNDGRSSAGKRSPDHSLLKHEIPEDISSNEDSFISTGEVFLWIFIKFYSPEIVLVN